ARADTLLLSRDTHVQNFPEMIRLLTPPTRLRKGADDASRIGGVLREGSRRPYTEELSGPSAVPRSVNSRPASTGPAHLHSQGGTLVEPSQQPLRFLLRQPSSNHRLTGSATAPRR